MLVDAIVFEAQTRDTPAPAIENSSDEARTDCQQAQLEAPVACCLHRAGRTGLRLCYCDAAKALPVDRGALIAAPGLSESLGLYVRLSAS
jgi:hypothetical protein